ncbi:MAG: DNA helicase RecQ [Eubacteriales bacterium]|jgi:ATP-dependent DNA helicase RecQ
MDKLETLRKFFGHDAFREGQETLVDALLQGRDVFGVMPTGAGKSICYQIPALMLPGVTIVVSPLISLMKDQVEALVDAGIPAAFLNSSLSSDEYTNTLSDARRGAYKLLYVAPERLLTDSFLRFSQSVPISLVAIDEAHCVSQWGQDFRPSYLKIVEYIDRLPVRPVVGAFTATATHEVRDDIIRMLQLHDPLTLVTGFNRPNLRFEVLRPRNKNAALLSLIRGFGDRSGIVYCATRKAVESVCELLTSAGLPVTRYHAGLSDDERRKNQEDFAADRCPIIAATNAFGMGIDKSNVGYVIHYNLPKNLESYYQEAGRAGRDGEPATCTLLYSARDVSTARWLVEHSGDHSDIDPQTRELLYQRDMLRLDAMCGYAVTTDCLRAILLRYFGEPAPDICGNCSNCSLEFETRDITVEAQMLLSCVYRLRKKERTVGIALLADILRGKGRRVDSPVYRDLSTFGLLSEMPTAKIRAIIEHLVHQGYLAQMPGSLPVLTLTRKARGVLFHGEPVFMKVAKPQPRTSSATRPVQTSLLHKPSGGEDEVFVQLKLLRTLIADREKLPPYMIFSDATLRDMAKKLPLTDAEFLAVSGIGQAKLRKYGEQFMTLLRLVKR